MRFALFVVLLLVAVVGVSFAVINSDTVVLDYYIGQVSVSLSILVTLSFASGVMIGAIVSLLFSLKLRRQLMVAEHAAHKNEKELNSLRTLPAKDLP